MRRRVRRRALVTIPDDTVLDVELGTALASDTSRVEEDVRARSIHRL